MTPLRLAFQNLPTLFAGMFLGGLFLFWLSWFGDLFHGHRVQLTIEPTEVHECTQSTSTSLH